METQHHRKSGTIPVTVVLILAALPLIVVMYLVTNSPRVLQIFTSASSQYSDTDLPLVKTEERQGDLVADFPDLPVFDGAIVESSFAGIEHGHPVYNAVWVIHQIDGKPLDVTSVRKVMHWFEDDAFPELWMYDEPLQQEGDADNPSKSWITVSKNGVRVTVTVEAPLVQSPVLVTAYVTKL